MGSDIDKAFELGVLFEQEFVGFDEFSDVRPDGEVPVDLSLGINHRDDGGPDPVERAVFGAVADVALPDLTSGDCFPEIDEELL